ncbi:HAMP domain-containing protein [Pelagibius litoralis]|uniref:histidine kinase n=1 Tax=Pelagibius litoralis TaxID=374515 RepID=A0A967F2X2_9PROT|nr:ATP-binding protein [Pelagibius litoralis]NIA71920.1 HAMP domain-containing protein [Pelagibius litoralis]
MTSSTPNPLYPHGGPGPIRRFLPRSLLGRSVLIIVTPLILLQVISTWIFYDRHYDTITKRLAQGLAGDVAAVVTLTNRSEDNDDLVRIFSLAKSTMQLELSLSIGAELLVPDVVVSRGVVDARLHSALQERLRVPFVVDTRSLDERVEILVQLNQGVLRVLVTDERLFSSTTYIFIFWTIGSSILLFGVAVIFMRNQVKPIRRLAHAAESFGKGREVVEFKPEGATEVRQAAVAFINMRNRLNRQVQQRTEMLAGVSHDLRTPLTRMKLQLEMLKDTPEVDNLQSDVVEMEHMVEGYLAFARGEGKETPVPTNLCDLLRDVVSQMTRDGGVIDLHLEQDIALPLRREAMRRCLTNLIGNAQRYGQQVAVRAGHRRNLIEITVEDDGPGIPPERHEDVFKPFFRLEQSRNPATGGVGLGLTIARDVARSHGGDLILEAAPGGGLRARIWLPA